MPSRAALDAIARERFGYTALREEQHAALAGVLAAQDTVVVLPTGSGKSAIYFMAAAVGRAPVVVVSPLVALQHDQVAHAGTLRTAVLNSVRGQRAHRDAMHALQAGEVDVLLLAPEQLQRDDVRAALTAARPGVLAVDEVHLVSEWGHDFRPAYLALADTADAIGRPPILGLTATAAPPVLEEVAQRLRLQDPVTVVGGFDRPELRLAVRHHHGRGRADRAAQQGLVLDILAEHPRPAIVYTASRAECERLAVECAAREWSTVAYHGAMSRERRERAQEAFMTGGAEVIVATSAFGMGVDKPDVRLVVHAQAPGSLDAYYQEIGRAGRDRQPADAVLVFNEADLAVPKMFASGRLDPDAVVRVAAALTERMTFAALAERAEVSRDLALRIAQALADAGAVTVRAGKVARRVRDDAAMQRAIEQALEDDELRMVRERSRVDTVRAYGETRECRRRLLLGYFGEVFDGPCGHCDNDDDRADADSAAGPPPLPIGSRVRHVEWGDGDVLEGDDHALLVRFDSVGYRTLAASAVADGLLAAAD